MNKILTHKEAYDLVISNLRHYESKEKEHNERESYPYSISNMHEELGELWVEEEDLLDVDLPGYDDMSSDETNRRLKILRDRQSILKTEVKRLENKYRKKDNE